MILEWEIKVDLSYFFFYEGSQTSCRMISKILNVLQLLAAPSTFTENLNFNNFRVSEINFNLIFYWWSLLWWQANQL